MTSDYDMGIVCGGWSSDICAQRTWTRFRQSGVAYLAVPSLMGAVSVAGQGVSSLDGKREREEELLSVGSQFVTGSTAGPRTRQRPIPHG